MIGQPEQWNEELLSAYVDGEVTDEQRALVEARLVGDPSLRAVFAEIEAARDAVRSLPQRDAPPEFWARILDGTGLDAASAAAATAAAPASAPVVPLESRRRASPVRRWVAVAGGAAAAAVIAAVVLVPSPERVDPPVASFTDAHAVRNSLDSDAVSSLAPVALQAGFQR